MSDCCNGGRNVYQEPVRTCPICDGPGKVIPVNLSGERHWLPIADHEPWCPLNMMTWDNITAYTTKQDAINAWNTRTLS